MNSIRSFIRTRRGDRDLDQVARTAVETRKVQTVHGNNCICHRCRRA